jgi:hypothetical protein
MRWNFAKPNEQKSIVEVSDKHAYQDYNHHKLYATSKYHSSSNNQQNISVEALYFKIVWL